MKHPGARPIKLVPLEVGRLDADLIELIGTPGRRVMPVPSWLIEHPNGVVLFDTGLHRDLQHSPSRLRGLFKTAIVDFLPGKELAARIAAAGSGAEDIDLIVFPVIVLLKSGRSGVSIGAGLLWIQDSATLQLGHTNGRTRDASWNDA